MGKKIEVVSPIDIHVGERIRQRREFLGLTQEEVSAALGLRYQQVQKYEKAINRISASKLLEIAQLLKVPVSFFFEGLEKKTTPAAQDKLFDSFKATRGAETLMTVYVQAPPPKRTKLLTQARRLIEA